MAMGPARLGTVMLGGQPGSPGDVQPESVGMEGAALATGGADGAGGALTGGGEYELAP